MSCHRVPTSFFRFRSNSGFIFLRRVQVFEGTLCLLCARRVFRDMQSHNLTLGWWGLTSFAGMIVFLIDNRDAYRRGIAPLRPPVPADPRNDLKLAGRPVLARPSVLFVFAILVTAVVGFTTDGFGIDRDEWQAGACVDYSGNNVMVVPCDDPMSEGKVLAIIDDVFACPAEAKYIVDLDTRIACLA